MKTNMRGLIIYLIAVGGMVLSAGNVNAQINMPEREHVQNIVWMLEFVTFVTAIVIGLFVWRISKRDQQSKKSKDGNS